LDITPEMLDLDLNPARVPLDKNEVCVKGKVLLSVF
jgi:hypothetical protein